MSRFYASASEALEKTRVYRAVNRKLADWEVVDPLSDDDEWTFVKCGSSQILNSFMGQPTVPAKASKLVRGSAYFALFLILINFLGFCCLIVSTIYEFMFGGLSNAVALYHGVEPMSQAFATAAFVNATIGFNYANKSHQPLMSYAMTSTSCLSNSHLSNVFKPELKCDQHTSSAFDLAGQYVASPTDQHSYLRKWIKNLLLSFNAKQKLIKNFNLTIYNSTSTKKTMIKEYRNPNCQVGICFPESLAENEEEEALFFQPEKISTSSAFKKSSEALHLQLRFNTPNFHQTNGRKTDRKNVYRVNEAMNDAMMKRFVDTVTVPGVGPFAPRKAWKKFPGLRSTLQGLKSVREFQNRTIEYLYQQRQMSRPFGGFRSILAAKKPLESLAKWTNFHQTNGRNTPRSFQRRFMRNYVHRLASLNSTVASTCSSSSINFFKEICSYSVNNMKVSSTFPTFKRSNYNFFNLHENGWRSMLKSMLEGMYLKSKNVEKKALQVHPAFPISTTESVVIPSRMVMEMENATALVKSRGTNLVKRASDALVLYAAEKRGAQSKMCSSKVSLPFSKKSICEKKESESQIVDWGLKHLKFPGNFSVELTGTVLVGCHKREKKSIHAHLEHVVSFPDMINKLSNIAESRFKESKNFCPSHQVLPGTFTNATPIQRLVYTLVAPEEKNLVEMMSSHSKLFQEKRSNPDTAVVVLGFDEFQSCSTLSRTLANFAVMRSRKISEFVEKEEEECEKAVPKECKQNLSINFTLPMLPKPMRFWDEGRYCGQPALSPKWLSIYPVSIQKEKVSTTTRSLKAARAAYMKVTQNNARHQGSHLHNTCFSKNSTFNFDGLTQNQTLSNEEAHRIVLRQKIQAFIKAWKAMKTEVSTEERQPFKSGGCCGLAKNVTELRAVSNASVAVALDTEIYDMWRPKRRWSRMMQRQRSVWEIISA